MIGFFLCDAPEGEQVMAPPVLLRPFDMRQPDTEPVTALVNQVLAVAEFENSLISSRKVCIFFSKKKKKARTYKL